MTKKKSNKLMGSVKETASLGVASMGGMAAMGVMGGAAVKAGAPHHAVSGLQTTTGAALGLANTGNLAKQAFVLVDVMDKQKGGSKKMWAPVETKESAKRRRAKQKNQTDFINTMMQF